GLPLITYTHRATVSAARAGVTRELDDPLAVVRYRGVSDSYTGLAIPSATGHSHHALARQVGLRQTGCCHCCCDTGTQTLVSAAQVTSDIINLILEIACRILELPHVDSISTVDTRRHIRNALARHVDAIFVDDRTIVDFDTISCHIGGIHINGRNALDGHILRQGHGNLSGTIVTLCDFGHDVLALVKLGPVRVATAAHHVYLSIQRGIVFAIVGSEGQPIVQRRQCLLVTVLIGGAPAPRVMLVLVGADSTRPIHD